MSQRFPFAFLMPLACVLLALALFAGLLLVSVRPVLSASDAPAGQQQFDATEDAVITSQYPISNYGSAGSLVVATRQSSGDEFIYHHDRSLLRYDLSAIPVGSVVDSATLEVNLAFGAGSAEVPIWASPVTGVWTESEVTWDNQPAFDTSRAVSTTVDSSIGYKSWDVTDFARDWHAGTGEGVILYGPEPSLGPGYVRTFRATEPNEYIPRLTVTFHTPPPPVGDLVMVALASDPNPAFATEPVKLTATVQNEGDDPVADVPVHFYVDGNLVAAKTIPLIEVQTSADVTAEVDFDETGAYEVSATVNPDGTLPDADADPDNNSASLFQAIVVEKYPIWSKPDLALEGLTFDPARPGPGSPVGVSAEIRNIGRPDIAEILVALFVDGVAVDETLVDDIPSGIGVPVTLYWPSAQPGRHWVNMVIDPEMTMDERSKGNSELGGWLRVSGDPEARPDLEVSDIRIAEADLQASAERGEDLHVEILVQNAGYIAADSFPIEVLVDGRSAVNATAPQIDPGLGGIVPAVIPDPGLGYHIITARLDPDNSLSLDLLQRDWARGFNFPTPDFKPALYTGPSSADLSGRWEFIGPRPMRGEYKGVTYYHNGRVDGFDLTSDAKIMVVGTVGGGVWRSDDYGVTWDSLTDPLNQPEFTRVALDPRDPDIIYAASGASNSIYKSLDGGESWSLFADRLSGGGSTKFTTILVRYEDSTDTVTLYVADTNGLWMWQGDGEATSAPASAWRHVWQQTRNAHTNATSAVTDLHITSESSPQVYLGALRDAVYRISLSALLDAVAKNQTPTWTAIETGMSITDQAAFFIDSSKAKADRVFVMVTRSTACAKDQGASLSLYRLDAGANQWTHVSDATDTSQTDNVCGISYVDFLEVNPAKPDILYIGGVQGYRSTDGGKTWSKSNRIPYVHDDFKWAAFKPSDPSVVYFSSDGGIYRCTNDGASCDSLNHDLETGMFFDIALAGAQNRLIIGGTQDNGTQRYDGSLEWRYIRGGDGRYCAIDLNNNDIMYSQHQHAIDTWQSVDGGKTWADTNVNIGMPSRDDYTGLPYLVLHPNKANTALITAGKTGSPAEVYRTVDGGKNWSPIGPAPAKTRGVRRILVDGPNDRCYAGTVGEIWAVKCSDAAANTWTMIYEDKTQGWAHEMVMDPNDPDTLYVLFTGWGTGARRVIELKRTGGTWPGKASDWQVTAIAGGLPDVTHFGGPNDAVRGLALEPDSGNATVLYVGTRRGIYQGRHEASASTWTWTLDSCGLPRTYISDIAVHSSGTWVAAATYGRGVYARNAGATIRTPDPYEQPVRNDTQATAAVLPNMAVPQSMFLPALSVEDLNLDRGDDEDYFRVKMPPFDPNHCLAANDPLLNQSNVFQCALGISISAPETPDPFEIALYRSDGTAYLTPTTQSGFGVTVERPYDAFADGVLILRIRDLTSCRAEYDLHFTYTRWLAVKDVPELLYEPPLINRIVPELGDFPWVFPADPVLIDRGFVEELDDLPEQRVTFPWGTTGDFSTQISVGGGRDLNVTLYNDQNQPIATATEIAASAGGSVTVKSLDYPDLPEGWYALGFDGGAFPTFFSVDAGEQSEHILLPLINRP